MLIGQAVTATLLDFVGQLPHGFPRNSAPVAASDGCLRHVSGYQNFRAVTFALFPQRKSFLDCVFFMLESSPFNSPAEKRFLIGCEIYFDAIRSAGGCRAGIDMCWPVDSKRPYSYPLIRICGAIW